MLVDFVRYEPSGFVMALNLSPFHPAVIWLRTAPRFTAGGLMTCPISSSKDLVPTATAILRVTVCVRCEHFQKTVPDRTCGLNSQTIVDLVNREKASDGTLFQCPANKW